MEAESQPAGMTRSRSIEDGPERTVRWFRGQGPYLEGVGSLQPCVVVGGVQKGLCVRSQLPVEGLRVFGPDAKGEYRGDVADHGLPQQLRQLLHELITSESLNLRAQQFVYNGDVARRIERIAVYGLCDTVSAYAVCEFVRKVE